VKITSRSNACARTTKDALRKWKVNKKGDVRSSLFLWKCRSWPVPQSEVNWLHVSPIFPPGATKASTAGPVKSGH
jgi:hypothetical protein